MPGWQAIEGFLSEEDAKVIGPAVNAVADNGWIIEIGCFKGRQSRFIAENKKASVKLSCIDPFPDRLVNFDDSRTYRNYMFYEWQNHLMPFENVEAVRSLSPFDISFLSFTKVPDLVVLDVDSVFDSLKFWHRFADEKTQFFVHTYRHEHQRITEQIAKAVEELGFNAEFKNSLALMKKGSL